MQKKLNLKISTSEMKAIGMHGKNIKRVKFKYSGNRISELHKDTE
jgi:hypothetical protein